MAISGEYLISGNSVVLAMKTSISIVATILTCLSCVGSAGELSATFRGVRLPVDLVRKLLPNGLSAASLPEAVVEELDKAVRQQRATEFFRWQTPLKMESPVTFDDLKLLPDPKAYPGYAPNAQGYEVGMGAAGTLRLLGSDANGWHSIEASIEWSGDGTLEGEEPATSRNKLVPRRKKLSSTAKVRHSVQNLLGTLSAAPTEDQEQVSLILLQIIDPANPAVQPVPELPPRTLVAVEVFKLPGKTNDNPVAADLERMRGVPRMKVGDLRILGTKGVRSSVESSSEVSFWSTSSSLEFRPCGLQLAVTVDDEVSLDLSRTGLAGEFTSADLGSKRIPEFHLHQVKSTFAAEAGPQVVRLEELPEGKEAEALYFALISTIVAK